MEKPKQKPTTKQTKVAKAIVENLVVDKPESIGEILKNTGYGKDAQNNPGRVIESEGVQTALKEVGLKTALTNAGVTPDKIAKKVNVLLDAKKGEEDDYTAIDKGLKHATAIHGIEQGQEKSGKGNIYNFFINSEAQTRIREAEEDIKELLTSKKVNVKG